MRSEYSLLQRDAGTTYLHRLISKRGKIGLMMLATNYMIVNESTDEVVDDEPNELISMLIMGSMIVPHERPCLVIPDGLHPRLFYGQHINTGEMVSTSGFSHIQFKRMVRTYGINNHVRIGGD